MTDYTERPVVLIYIGGDSYGGDATTFAGSGEPLVVVFDAGRYDKYNREPDADPAGDYAEDLEQLTGDARAQLQAWIDEVA